MRFFENDLDDGLLPVARSEGRHLSFPAEADVKLADIAVRFANEEAARMKTDEAKMREKWEDAVANARRADPRATEAKETAVADAERAKQYATKAKKAADADAKRAEQHAVKAREAAVASNSKVAATFKGWRSQEIGNFCIMFQWPFMAPVFNQARFNYRFHEKTVMPFWPSGVQNKSGGYFSHVEKWQVPRVHLQFKSVSSLSRCTSLRPTMSIPRRD